MKIKTNRLQEGSSSSLQEKQWLLRALEPLQHYRNMLILLRLAAVQTVRATLLIVHVRVTSAVAYLMNHLIALATW